ncbi:glycosyl hydrolase family 18 protein [Microbulbifer sp. 2205BS26-8]|uniref:glycosyl hydrolase family 18 protein n=1 Tax=Microbulbifer sp. 2205BS26-8 TaxID=3064386 RepID=UPI00273FC1F7|nr:glycosyl hydrolase family 18 protein [Microbulbifer sp. 2205BS26-8]MDP5210059.1 glycosyl hydrolase family 18 protein [Microbulbifer sp. 2205BS26-8]
MPTEYTEGTAIPVNSNMWWGENGTSWVLTSNNSQVCAGDLTPSGNNAQMANCTISASAGTHQLQVILSNAAGSSASAEKTIYVVSENGTPPDPQPIPDPEFVETPAKPVIALMDTNQSAGDITVSWNMWWGVNGSSWTLESNGSEVCNNTLTVNGNNAQHGSCTVNFAKGSYDLQVLLTNAAGSTASDIKTISVGDAGGGVVGSSETPLPTDYSSPGLRKHKPYSNTTNSVVGAYFVEWGIYGRNYQPAQIPASNLTHLLYGFIPICGPNQSLQEANPSGYSVLLQSCQGKQDFEVTVHDQYAALDKLYPGDDDAQDYKGVFNQLRRIKLANPDLVIVPSVGGWTLSDPFYYLDNAANRKVFVDSMVEFLNTYTFFDGVDIDWEYPGGGGANADLGKESDGETYVTLMQDLRTALDTLESETGRQYQLTSAVGVSPAKISQVDYAQASPYMDYIFAMSYDYYGAWSEDLGHHAGLYPTASAIHEGFSGDETVTNLLTAGVPAHKLAVGVAMYGRGWKGVSNMTSQDPFSGKGGGPISLTMNNGHWEAGVVDYFRIVQEMLGGDPNSSGVNGWSAGYDDTAKAPYVWKPSTGELITYENGKSAKTKAEYVRQRGLAGTFSWEIDADNGDILNAVHEGLGHPQE